VIKKERKIEPAFLNLASQKHDRLFIVAYLLAQRRQLCISLGLRSLQLAYFQGKLRYPPARDL
jgi:hypothetical protein